MDPVKGSISALTLPLALPKEKRAQIGAKTKVYDAIAVKVPSQSRQIDSLVCQTRQNPECFENNMRLVCIYAAYIKRMANLLLLAAETEELSSTELVLALRESARYLTKAGIPAAVFAVDSECYLPSAYVVWLFEQYQHLIEQALPSLRGLQVTLTDTALKMTVEGAVLTLPAAASGTAETDEDTTFLRLDLLMAEDHRFQARNHSVKAYGGTIDDTVRREEILKTKIRIHDEMNRLLLITDHAIGSNDPDERELILNTWQKNTLLLVLEADNESERDALNDLFELSGMIGIGLDFEGTPRTEDTSVIRLFVLAVEEAMTNAVKHAGAKHLLVKVMENENILSLEISNDGLLPKAPIQETGGLAVLRNHLEQCGGTMTILHQQGFKLMISIPKGEPSIALSCSDR